MLQLEFNKHNLYKIQETITTRMQITEEEIEEMLVELLKKMRKKILLLKKSKLKLIDLDRYLEILEQLKTNSQEFLILNIKLFLRMKDQAMKDILLSNLDLHKMKHS